MNSPLAAAFDAVVALAGAVVTACLPILVYWLGKKVGYDADTNARDAMTATLQRGVGRALELGRAAGDASLSDARVKSRALDEMLAYVGAGTVEARQHFGLTDERLAEMARAELELALPVPPLIDVATPNGVHPMTLSVTPPPSSPGVKP